MKIRGKVRSFIALALLFIYAAYYVNTKLCWHTHVSNSVTIVHSHLHSPDHHSTADGGHSGGQFIIIDIINAELLLTAAAVTVCPVVVLRLLDIIGARRESLYRTIHSKLRSMRAPPAFANLVS